MCVRRTAELLKAEAAGRQRSSATLGLDFIWQSRGTADHNKWLKVERRCARRDFGESPQEKGGKTEILGKNFHIHPSSVIRRRFLLSLDCHLKLLQDCETERAVSTAAERVSGSTPPVSKDRWEDWLRSSGEK